jgi:hypothetical protein
VPRSLPQRACGIGQHVAPPSHNLIRPNEDKIRSIEITSFVRVDVQDF